MPNVNVNPFFSFSRVKITKQYVDEEQNVVYIYMSNRMEDTFRFIIDAVQRPRGYIPGVVGE